MLPAPLPPFLNAVLAVRAESFQFVFAKALVSEVASASAHHKRELAAMGVLWTELLVLHCLNEELAWQFRSVHPYLTFIFRHVSRAILSSPLLEEEPVSTYFGLLGTRPGQKLHKMLKSALVSVLVTIKAGQPSDAVDCDSETPARCPATRELLLRMRDGTCKSQCFSRGIADRTQPLETLRGMEPILRRARLQLQAQEAGHDLAIFLDRIVMIETLADGDYTYSLPSMSALGWLAPLAEGSTQDEEFGVRMGQAVLNLQLSLLVRATVADIGEQEVAVEAQRAIVDALLSDKATSNFLYRAGVYNNDAELWSANRAGGHSQHPGRALRLFFAALHFEKKGNVADVVDTSWQPVVLTLCEAYSVFRAHAATTTVSDGPLLKDQTRAGSPLPEERTPKRRHVLKVIQSPSVPTSSTPASMDLEAAGVENSPGGASGDSPGSITATRRPRKSATLLVAPASTLHQSTPTPASSSLSPPTPASDSAVEPRTVDRMPARTTAERGVLGVSADASTAPREDGAGPSSVSSLAPASAPRRTPEAERRRGVDGRTKIPEIRASTTPRPKALRAPSILDINMAPAARQTSTSAQGTLETVRPAATDISMAAASNDGSSRGMSETQRRKLVPGRTTIPDIRASTTPRPKALRVPGFPDIDLAPAATHDLSTASTEWHSATTTRP
ncbi:hypothetical protein C8R46DRAFT_1043786 [Mycena filopes]|nr:hypothetical protein C8R46DRAFT_1043786 [Mycena filopes]